MAEDGPVLGVERWRRLLKADRERSPAVWNQSAEGGEYAGTADPWEDKRQRSNCERWVKDAWENGHVQFLVQELQMLGKVFEFENVKCVGGFGATTLSGRGGYVWRDTPEAGLKHGEVAVSQKDCQSPQDVASSLRHELIHAFDDARASVDAANCSHHACSEIRAARLSGECALGEELLRGKPLTGDGSGLPVGQQCVKRRAILSVSHNPACSRIAQHAVDTVWDRCVVDTAPYMKYPLDVIFA
ncbi:Mitochondrial inner membrane protease ATP23 [Diplonema papillatum]|nr:Mitochondrial inner membrane protease ATP23 [Diplonema papillatum]